MHYGGSRSQARAPDFFVLSVAHLAANDSDSVSDKPASCTQFYGAFRLHNGLHNEAQAVTTIHYMIPNW